MNTSWSIMLPHPWVTKTEYLRLYGKQKPMLDFVDSMMNCEDIFFNAIVAPETGQPPVGYDINVNFIKWASLDGLSAHSGNWAGRRDQCVQRVMEYFKGLPKGVYSSNVLPLGSNCVSRCSPDISADHASFHQHSACGMEDGATGSHSNAPDLMDVLAENEKTRNAMKTWMTPEILHGALFNYGLGPPISSLAKETGKDPIQHDFISQLGARLSA